MLYPNNQINLFGFEKLFNELTTLYNDDKFPNKILFTGQKGIGKSTLSYHLINSILSKGEKLSYDFKNYKIDNQNKTFKLTK